MTVMKRAYAAMQDPVLDQRHWAQIHGERGRLATAKFASTSKVAASRYLLSHVTIMASVMTEPQPYDYMIKPECSHLCNSNLDAWENEVLRMSFPTFVGSFNFVEHYQNSKASKGYLIDSVLRLIRLGPDVFVYYCDLLVATNLEHEDLVAKIRSGEIKYLSMGCLTDLITCSYCGASGDGSAPPCIHQTGLYKGRFKPDQWGVPRIICELCGHRDLPGGGVRFVEASWVNRPAFAGASVRKIMADEWELPESIIIGAQHRAASLILPPSCTSKAASLITIPVPQLLNPQCERPEPRVLSELRRLR